MNDVEHLRSGPRHTSGRTLGPPPQRSFHLLLAIAAIWSGLFSTASAWGQSAGVNGLSIQDLTDGIRSRAARYSAAHYKFDETNYDEGKADHPIVAYEYDLYRSDGMLSYSREPLLPGSKLPTDRAAWNGEELTAYATYSRNAPDHRYSGKISAQQPRFYGKWAVIVRGELLETRMSISEAVGTGEWTALGSRQIGQVRAWGLASTQPLGASGQNVEIWVAPLKDFAPVEISETKQYGNGRMGRTRLGDVELKQFGDRWIIQHAKVFTLKSGTGAEQVAEFELHEYTAGIPANFEFVTRFPVGTHVFDQRRQMGFVAGKFVEVIGADRLMRRADISLFPEYNALTDRSAGLTEAEYRKTPWARAEPQKTIQAADYIERPTVKADPRRRWGLLAACLLAVGTFAIGWIYAKRASHHA